MIALSQEMRIVGLWRRGLPIDAIAEQLGIPPSQARAAVNVAAHAEEWARDCALRALGRGAHRGR